MNQLAPARRTIIDYLQNPKTLEGIKAVAGRYLRPDRMLRLVTNAIRRVPKLQECDPQSFLGAVMMSASLELEPNTPQGHAFFIPYDRRGRLPNGEWGVVGVECQFIIGYRGFIELAYRNPNISKFIAKPIYQNDFFDHEEGSQSFLRYKPSLGDPGPLVGAFAYARYRTQHGAEAEVAVVLPLQEIIKARSKSETYNSLVRGVEKARNDKEREKAEKKLAETPWVMWFGDMAAKTAIRKAAKILPIGGSFAAAAALDEAAEANTLDLSAMADPGLAKAVADGDDEAPVLDYQPQEEMPDLSMPTAPEFVQNQQQKAMPQEQKTNTAPAVDLSAPRSTRRTTAKASTAPAPVPDYDPQTGEIHEDYSAGSLSDDNLFNE